MTKCNVCGKNQKLFFLYNKFKYFKCKKCGLVTTTPIPSEEIILQHYKNRFLNGNYSLLIKYDNEYKKVYMDFIHIIKNVLKKEKLSAKKMEALDIGCFTGSFLLLLKKIGFGVTGLELQQDAVTIAKKRLHNRVFTVDIMTDKLPNKKYDLVSMLGLIEHVKNPTLLIKKTKSLLNENGLIIIQTPDSASIPAQVLQKYWPPFSPIEHIHLFSRKSLVLLLLNSGFEVVHSSHHIKKLPFSYVFNMLDNFGPEFKKILNPFYAITPKKLRDMPLPFYIGEMIIVAKKLPNV